MSITSATSSVNPNPTSIKGLVQQRRTDFQSLASAVQSGDLSGAQTALSALQTDTQNIQSLRGGSTPGQPSKLQSDFANLISSIQAGNASGAQTALTTLQTDRQAQIGSSVGATNAIGASSQSNVKQDLAALLQAIQSGDMTGAQDDLSKLQADAKTQGAGHHHHHHATKPVDTLSAAIDAIPAPNPATNSANVTATSAYAAMMAVPSSSSLSAQA